MVHLIIKNVKYLKPNILRGNYKIEKVLRICMNNSQFPLELCCAQSNSILFPFILFP